MKLWMRIICKQCNVYCYCSVIVVTITPIVFEKKNVIFLPTHFISIIIAPIPLLGTINEAASVIKQFDSIVVTPLFLYVIKRRKIADIIKSLKNRKSPSIGGINNLCLKQLSRQGVHFLANIINGCVKLC